MRMHLIQTVKRIFIKCGSNFASPLRECRSAQRRQRIAKQDAQGRRNRFFFHPEGNGNDVFPVQQTGSGEGGTRVKEIIGIGCFLVENVIEIITHGFHGSNTTRSIHKQQTNKKRSFQSPHPIGRCATAPRG